MPKLEVQVVTYEMPEGTRVVDHWPSSGNAVDDEYQAMMEVSDLSVTDPERFFSWRTQIVE